MHGYTLAIHSRGLAIDLSPPCGVPDLGSSFREQGKERGNFLTGTPESSQAKGQVKGGTCTIPLLMSDRFFFYEN